MIEHIAKMAEIGQKGLESKSMYDPDKKVLKDVRTNESKYSEQYNPDNKVPKWKDEIKQKTGWPNEIVDFISTPEQCDIYEKANLSPSIINGRQCLIKSIDLGYVDPKTGMTNRELMQRGRAPIDSKTGEKIELHHMNQDKDAPFAELCENSEHGDGNDLVLHDKSKPSWRRDPAANEAYKTEKKNHWKTRAMEA